MTSAYEKLMELFPSIGSGMQYPVVLHYKKNPKNRMPTTGIGFATELSEEVLKISSVLRDSFGEQPLNDKGKQATIPIEAIVRIGILNMGQIEFVDILD